MGLDYLQIVSLLNLEDLVLNRMETDNWVRFTIQVKDDVHLGRELLGAIRCE